MTFSWCYCCVARGQRSPPQTSPALRAFAFLLVWLAMSASTSCPIPGGRDPLPNCYSITPGGTLYATTPGGTRIIYERKFLLECKNSPIARTPPCCLPQIPGVTIPTSPPSKLEELKEQKETVEERPDDEQFEMDI